MEIKNAIRLVARKVSSICSARIGDCIGMMTAGAIFVAMASRVEHPEAFRQPGLYMIAVGAVLTVVGLKWGRVR